MDNEKKELISKLYTLRAGLSLIAEQNDILKKEENKIIVIDKNTEYNKKSIESNESKANYERRHLPKLERDIKEAKKSLKSHKRSLVFEIWYLGVGFLFAIGGLIAAFIKYAINDGKDYPWSWVIIAAIVGCVGAYVYAVIDDQKSGYTKRHEERVTETEKALTNSKQTINYCSNKNQSLTAQNEKFKQDRKVAVTVYNEQVGVIVPTIKSLYDALDAEFGSIVDKRDWSNLDLIIYYFETGRADTIKDALLLADRQRQMDTLVSAINDARSEICKTITTSINTLREDINRSFASLASTIRSQHQAQMKAIGQMNSTISSMGAQIGTKLDTIATNSAMQSALLSKISATTSTLAATAEDIYYNGVKAY